MLIWNAVYIQKVIRIMFFFLSHFRGPRLGDAAFCKARNIWSQWVFFQVRAGMEFWDENRGFAWEKNRKFFMNMDRYRGWLHFHLLMVKYLCCINEVLYSRINVSVGIVGDLTLRLWRLDRKDHFFNELQHLVSGESGENRREVLEFGSSRCIYQRPTYRKTDMFSPYFMVAVVGLRYMNLPEV